MPLDLPGGGPRKIRTVAKPQQEELAPEDIVEFGVTQEVSPGPGRKAWIKYGVMSSVRDGETTEDARHRIVRHVLSNHDRLLDELE